MDNYQNEFLILKVKESDSDTASDSVMLTRLGRAIYAKDFDFIAETILTEAEICLQLAEPFLPAH